MNCPHCQTEVRTPANFCGNCGCTWAQSDSPLPLLTPRGVARQLIDIGLAGSPDDPAMPMYVAWDHMFNNVYTVLNLPEALIWGERAAALCHQLDLQVPLACMMTDLALVYWGMGQAAKATVTINDATALWRTLDSKLMLANALIRHMQFLYFRGEHDEATRNSDEAYSLSQSIDHRWVQSMSRFQAGYMAYMDRGEINRAITVMKQGIDAAQETGNFTVDIAMSADLGWLYCLLGASHQAQSLVTYALDVAYQQAPNLIPWTAARMVHLNIADEQLFDAEEMVKLAYEYLPAQSLMVSMSFYLALAEGELRFAQRNFDEANRVADKLIDQLYRMQMRPHVPDALLLKSRVLAAQGRFDEARKVNLKARAAAEALGMRRIMWEILYDLSQIDAWRGERESATTWHQQAVRICRQVADSIGDADLRESFVGQSHVRRVLSL